MDSGLDKASGYKMLPAMSGMPELLPPEPTKVTPELSSRSGTWKKTAVLGISAAGCFGFVLWGINQFLSLRGVVSIAASRIVLAVTVAAAVLMLLSLTRFLGKRRNTFFWVCVIVLVCLAILLDWWAPKPNAIAKTIAKQPPATPSENHGTQDSVQPPVITHPSPSKLRTRQAIGDLIQEGTKIRDRAPAYIGEPTGPDVAVLNDWKAWCTKVDKFLKGNFDSAEAARFRALDDPNQSLNSKLHLEIQYLDDLLDRVGM